MLVDAPPDPFAVQTPADFVRTVPELRWDLPAHAVGGVKFAVTVDDDTVAEDVRGTRVKLKRGALDDGVSVVQVVAEDAGGQETTSLPAELKLDRRKPRVQREALPQPARRGAAERRSAHEHERGREDAPCGCRGATGSAARGGHGSRTATRGQVRTASRSRAADAAGNRVKLRRQVRP